MNTKIVKELPISFKLAKELINQDKEHIQEWLNDVAGDWYCGEIKEEWINEDWAIHVADYGDIVLSAHLTKSGKEEHYTVI